MPSINPQAVRGPVTAVPVVAGTGVRFVEDVQNNRVVAEADETVLWSSSTGIYLNDDSAILSEPINNFERVAIYAQSIYGGPLRRYEFEVIAGGQYRFSTDSLDGADLLTVYFNINITNTTITVSRSKLLRVTYSSNAVTTANMSSTTAFKSYVMKIVGINRVSA